MTSSGYELQTERFAVETSKVESFSGSKTFDILDGINRMSSAIVRGKLDELERAREYLLIQDNSELGEAVLPNIVSRVDIEYNEVDNSLSQLGFNMNNMMKNGLEDAKSFPIEKQFEFKRRTEEYNNYFRKILPNAKKIINGESQFLEVSPAPDVTAVDVEAAHSLGYDPENGVGVIRVYRGSKVKPNAIEIVQIKVPTDYESCRDLLISMNLAKKSDFTSEDVLDGSHILSKGGFIDPNFDMYSILDNYLVNHDSDNKSYSSLKEDIDNFQERIRPLRDKYMKELNDYQYGIAFYLAGESNRGEGVGKSIREQIRKELSIKKVDIWRRFVGEINSNASIVVEMEKDGILTPVQIDQEGRIRICGQEIDATLSELLDSGARLNKVLAPVFTEDINGDLHFTCPSCNAANYRSPLFPKALIANCMFCGSDAVSCEGGSGSILSFRYEDKSDSKKKKPSKQ